MTDILTRSARIHAKIDQVAPYMMMQARKIWDHPDLAAIYPIYLEKMHSVVRSAVPLMDQALVEARKLPKNDKLAAILIEYLLQHREEERGHDIWLLEDYEALGGDREVPLSQIPGAESAHLVGAQYYWLRHCHPVSILGHMMALEGYHPPAGFAKTLSTKSHLPMRAFRSIRRHESLDVVHKAELFELVDSLPLSQRQEKLVTISGLHTMRCAAELLETIISNPGSHQQTEFEVGVHIEEAGASALAN